MIYFIFITMILYGFTLLIIGSVKTKRKMLEHVFIFLSFMLLFIMSGWRSANVGMDTAMYVRLFEQIKSFGSFEVFDKRFEVGYRLYNYVISKFFASPHALLVISAFFILVIIFWFFRKTSKYIWFSILMYVTLMMYYNSMNLTRQYIAIAITSLAIYWLGQKKLIVFLFMVTVATLFHSSSAIVFVLLLILKFEITPRNRNMTIVAFFAAFFAFNHIIEIFINILPRYSEHVGSTYYLTNQLASFLKTSVLFAIYWFKDRIYFKYQRYSSGLNARWYKIEYVCSFLAFIISLFSIQGAIIERMGFYFSIVNCVTLANALNSIPNRKIKYQYAGVVIASCTIYNLVILVFRPYWSGVIPYTFWN